MVVSVINQKGGTGKTTLSVHLAVAFALQGKRVQLVDADPQGSATDWSAARSTTPLVDVVALPSPEHLPKAVAAAHGVYDVVVVDGPPRTDSAARAAVIVADVVLLPVLPSPLDVWAVDGAVRIVKEAQAVRPGLVAAFVINRRARNQLSRDVAEALEDYALPCLESSLSQRVAYADSMGRGLTVLETPGDKPAKAEVVALAVEVLALR